MAVSNYKPMQIRVLNIERYVKAKNIPKVASTKKIGPNKTVDEKGLFSEKIFGRFGSKERMTNMAYIDLNTFCLQPYICIALENSSADFVKTIMGTLKWKLNNGKLEKCINSEEEGLTGLQAIYSHYDLFVKELLKSTGSKTREDNIDLLKKHTKDELFTSKWLVIPAGYRDINTIDVETRGKSDYDQINDYYINIINAANRLGDADDLGINLIDVKLTYTIQQSINDIYRNLVETKLAKKRGLIQKSALSKTISYSAGNVISLPKMTLKSYDDKRSNNIPMGYLGIPTVQLIDIYYPFFLHRMKELFNFDEKLKNIISGMLESKKSDTLEEIIDKLAETAKVDTEFTLSDMVYNNERYSIIINGKERVLNILEFLKNEVIEPIISDKFITGTRYPIDNKLSQQYLKAKALLTEDTELIKDDMGSEYELCKSKIPLLSFQPSIMSLGSWGGDFDK